MKLTSKQITFVLSIIAIMLFAIWLGIVLSGHCPSCILK